MSLANQFQVNHFLKILFMCFQKYVEPFYKAYKVFYTMINHPDDMVSIVL